MNLPSCVLLSTAYCGAVGYFAAIHRAKGVYIEQHETYIKQTIRNRCLILGSNGVLPLVIPVEKGRTPGMKIRDVRIAWYEPWQISHWRAICSAYNNSPYFEHYRDEISPFYEKRWRFLFDFNMEFTEKLLELLELEQQVALTGAFEELPEEFTNLREAFSPRTRGETQPAGLNTPSYTQVFENKFPFIAGLSVLDLLFNKGREAVVVLGG